MFDLIQFAERFLRFFRDRLVPFFTEVPEYMSVPVYNPLVQSLDYIQIPWLFGDTPLAEFLLIGGLVALIVVRLVKFFTDAIGL